MKRILFILFYFITICYSDIYAQSNVSIKFFPVGIHLSQTPNSVALPAKIDEKARYAFEPGLVFSYETYSLNYWISLKIMQGILRDAASHWAGFTHVGLRKTVFKRWKHALAIGIGTTFFYRSSWADLPNYINYPDYKGDTDFQYKFVWLSGEIEYSHYFSKNSSITVALNHIEPHAIAVSVGYKYWINKKSKTRGCDCPSF